MRRNYKITTTNHVRSVPVLTTGEARAAQYFIDAVADAIRRNLMTGSPRARSTMQEAARLTRYENLVAMGEGGEHTIHIGAYSVSIGLIN